MGGEGVIWYTNAHYESANDCPLSFFPRCRGKLYLKMVLLKFPMVHSQNQLHRTVTLVTTICFQGPDLLLPDPLCLRNGKVSPTRHVATVGCLRASS